jgi:DNA-binding transcriptional ArsR family regulator
LLLEFVGSERTLSDVASTSGLGLSLLHHHVMRLLAFGLVEVVREEPRAGRPVRYYRATHDAFFVPSDLASGSFSEPLQKEMRRALENVTDQSSGILIDLDDEGRPRVRPVGEDGPSHPWEMWRILKLDRKAAADFGLELKALVRRFSMESKEKETFLLHVAFAKRHTH